MPQDETVSLLRTVEVGSATAETAITAVEDYGADPGTLLLRLGVVQLLSVQLEDLRATDDDEVHLLDAYRRWIEMALDYFGPAPEVTARDYAYASAVLTAEMHLASGGRMAQGGRGAVEAAPMGQS